MTLLPAMLAATIRPAASAIRTACGDRRFQVAAVVFLVLVLAGLWRMRLPRPPQPGVVATYRDGADIKMVAQDELRQYLHEYLPRCPRHLRCALHGEEHEDCSSDEGCEQFRSCGDEHADAHTLGTYRAAAASLVVDRLIGDLVARKKLAERKTVGHLMKHVSEEINISDLHSGWHKGQIRVDESEVKEYYDQNKEKFGAQSRPDVAEEIRSVLVAEKEKAFVDRYLKELRENASVSMNHDLLKFPVPEEGQLRGRFSEKQDEYRLPERIKLLLVTISTPDSSVAQDIGRRARTMLLEGAEEEDVRASVVAKEGSAAVVRTEWVSEKDQLWDRLDLKRRGRTEVTELVADGSQHHVARIQDREEPRAARFEDIRERLATEMAGELRQRHLNENGNATLFTIHGEPYTLSDFMEEFGELTAFEQARYDGFEGRKKLLESMVERALVVEDASDELRDAKNRKRLNRARLAVLKQVLHQEEVDDKIEIAEDKLRGFFDKNSAYYRKPARVKISLIRMDGGGAADEEKRAREKTEQALAELRALSPEHLPAGGFAEVAKRYSDDPNVANSGGAVEGWFTEGEDILSEVLYHELHRNVFGLKIAEVSEVFRMGESFCIALVREREEARERTFDEAKDMVREDLTELKHHELTANMENELVRKADARIFDYTILNMLKEEKRLAKVSAKPSGEASGRKPREAVGPR